MEAAFTGELLHHFEEQGYAIVRGVLDPEKDIKPVVDEYGALADQLAKTYIETGKIISYERPAAPIDRLLELMKKTKGRCFQALDITLPAEDKIRHDTPIHLGPEVFGLLRNERLLDAIEYFIGGEIYCVPVQHMRIKPPEKEMSNDVQVHTKTLTARTYWHQDLVVVTEDADQTKMLGVWFSLNEATEENGCLVVVPGSHKEGLVQHCNQPGKQGIPDALVGENQIALPVKPGDVIFLHPLIKHSSLANLSKSGRWSFDLRYCPTGQPTGRKWFPGFVARSRKNRDDEMRDPEVWANIWRDARAALADVPRPDFHHSSAPNHPLCA
ncbi:phytanoyl-CoA dioxygenase family protein [Agrobacterium vitis]|uniref:Phytanoyl-CoA dioxygenase family protein n=1 Tax=Agrobacterium vitis TaxID=373 RepID=A0AAE2RD76_AGRVI|nr:phytanoyl-CoA dioxygenase family protein [Agrobacterium vitis]MBF2714322.1 phytanoyl-CoA dioxygenase family protein [Agrobacterium vitis]MVA21984.1 phytanoyl-CoA dioxygenase [Agrobacterium vitis]